MNITKIPYITLDISMERDEYKKYSLEYVYNSENEIKNIIDRSDNGFNTHNLVDLQSQKYTPQMKDKIYFMSGVTVPRVKLKDLAVKYKIRTTTDIENATVIVGSSHASDKLVSSSWFYKCCKFRLKAFLDYAKKEAVLDGYYYDAIMQIIEPYLEDDNVKYFLTNHSTQRYLHVRGQNMPEDIIKAYEEVDANVDKGYLQGIRNSSNYYWTISDRNLKFLEETAGKTIVEQNALLEVINGDDCTTIDETTYENLRNMLNSSDSDNHVMAMEIMANCNYKESMLYLCFLFHYHWDDQMYSCKSKNHVNFKSLKNYMGVGSYYAHVDTIFNVLSDHNALDSENIAKVVSEFKEYFYDQNGNSDFIKVKSVELSESKSEEHNLKWSDDDHPTGVPLREVKTSNEDTVELTEENVDTEDTVDELKEKEVLKTTASLVQDEDVETKVVPAGKSQIIKKVTYGETEDSGFDWF